MTTIVIRDDDTGPDGSIGGEFDRWLDGVKRAAKAEAWDEGHHAGRSDADPWGPTYPHLTPNPYRQGANQ